MRQAAARPADRAMPAGSAPGRPGAAGWGCRRGTRPSAGLAAQRRAVHRQDTETRRAQRHVLGRVAMQRAQGAVQVQQRGRARVGMRQPSQRDLRVRGCGGGLQQALVVQLPGHGRLSAWRRGRRQQRDLPLPLIQPGAALPAGQMPKQIFQWTAGVLDGYRGKYDSKVPLNFNGVAPGAMVSLGWQFNRQLSVAAHALGDAGVMIQLADDLRRPLTSWPAAGRPTRPWPAGSCRSTPRRG